MRPGGYISRAGAVELGNTYRLHTELNEELIAERYPIDTVNRGPGENSG